MYPMDLETRIDSRETDEFRAWQTEELRAILSESGRFPIITGYAALFYDGSGDTEIQIDAGVIERFASGAFRESLQRGDDVRFLLNHDPNYILGRTRSGTLRLWEDARGLRYELTPPGNQLGKQVTDAVRRGDLTGASFAFKAEKQTFTTEYRSSRNVKVRTVESVRMGDVSLATFPAYQATTAELSSSPAITTGAPSPQQPSRIKMARYRHSMLSPVAVTGK